MTEEIYGWTDNPMKSGVADCNTDVVNDCLMHLKYENTTDAIQNMYTTGQVETQTRGFTQLKAMRHSTFDLSKFEVVGSPTITDDGVASGFQRYNYIYGNYPSITVEDKFEIDFAFKINELNGKTPILIGQDPTLYGVFYSPNVEIDNDGAFILAVYGDAYRRTAVTCPIGQKVFFKITKERNETKWKYYYSLDNSTWIFASEYTPSTLMHDGAKFAFNQNGWEGAGSILNGNVDLKHFSLKKNGKEVFSGNETGIDTVIGPTDFVNPILTSDGVLGGSTFAVSTNVPQNPGNHSPYLVFDGNWDKTSVDIMFHSAEGSTVGDFIIYNPLPLNLSSIYIQNQHGYNTRSSASGTVYGSNDNSIWEEITTYTNDGSTREWTINLSNNNNYYKYYKIHSNGAIDGSYWTISQMKLNGKVALEIPYTLSKTGSKIVDVAYRDRVIDLYEQEGQAGYYTIDETNKNFTLPMGEIYGMIEEKAVQIDEVRKSKVDKSDLAEIYPVVKTYVNGTSGYRIWSDGYCVQWGRSTVNQDSSVTITFLKPFMDTSYYANWISCSGTNTSSSGTRSADTLTTTTMRLFNGQDVTMVANWQASGYLAEGWNNEGI